MKYLLEKHSWLRLAFGMCTAYTTIYGIGHLVTALGWNFPMVQPAGSFQLVGFGISLTACGLLGIWTLRGIRYREPKRDEFGRQHAAHAIWERARHNYDESGGAQGR